MTKLNIQTENGDDIEIQPFAITDDSERGISIQVTGEIGKKIRSHVSVITPLQAIVMAAKLNKMAAEILKKG